MRSRLQSSRWLHRGLVAAGLLALMLAYFWRVVVLGRSLLPADHLFYYDPVWRSFAVEGGRASNPRQIDIVAQFYPYMAFNHDAVREGIFPLWNPYYLTGHPYFAGIQPAILFPLNWFFFWDPKAAWGLTAILRLWLAALFTYAYLREVKLGTWGALIGAITYSLSGYFIVRLHYTMANAQMLLPLLLWLTERMIKRPRLLWVPLAAGVFGAQFLAGHPETSFSLGVVWGLYAIYRLANQVRDAGSLRPAARPAILLALSAGIGVALAAVQLVPFLDLLQESATMRNRLGVFAGGWSPSPPLPQVGRHLLAGATLFLPNFFGTPLDRNWWTPLLEIDNYVFKINYFSQTRYLGLISLWLAGVGLFTRWRDRPVSFFGILAIASLLLDLRLPVISALYTVPPLRFAGGTLPPSVFMTGTAMLAGFGADTLARNRGSVSKRAWVGLVLLCLVTLVAALVMYFAVDTWNVDQLLQGRKNHKAILALYRPFTWRLYFPLAFGIAAIALFWAYRRRWLKMPITMALLVLLIAGEMYAFGWDYNPTMPPEMVFPETPAIRFLRDRAGLQRVSGLTLALKPNSSLVLGLQAIDGYEDLVSSRYLRFVGRNMEAWTREGDSLILEGASERLLDLASIRYLVIPQSQLLDEVGNEYPLVFQDENVNVFENVDTLPRAYVVHDAQVASAEEESLARIYAPDFDPRHSLVLEGEALPVVPAGAEGATTGPDEGVSGSDRVEIVQYGFQDVAVTVHLGQSGYLVLTDAFDPDWQASVDGRAAPLLRANDVFRAVALPPGEHTVTFHYSPRAVRVGLYASSAGLAIVFAMMAAVLVLSVRRHGKQNLE